MLPRVHHYGYWNDCGLVCASPQPQLPPTLSRGMGTVNQTSSYQEGEEAVGLRAAEEVAPIREQHG